MKPGRELDATIANKIFQYIVIYDGAKNDYFLSTVDLSTQILVPNFSTNVEASHLIIKKMSELGYHFLVESRVEDELGLYWRVSFHTTVLSFENGKSLPHAICMAALNKMKT